MGTRTVILCDASPLVALINRKDINHRRCVNALPGLSAPLVTTWPCFTVSEVISPLRLSPKHKSITDNSFIKIDPPDGGKRKGQKEKRIKRN
jgi:hypothetical protein